MNTLISLILATSLSFFSGEDTATTMLAGAKTGIQKAVAGQVSFPDDILAYSEATTVAVRFKIDEHNRIALMEADGANSSMTSHISKQLNNMQLNGQFDALSKDKPYVITLRLKQW